MPACLVVRTGAPSRLPRIGCAGPAPTRIATSASEEKSIRMQKVASWLLIIPSAAIGILLFEIFARLLLPSISSAAALPPIIYLFDGPGTVFRNYGDIFTYIPHSDIRVVTVAYSDKDFSIEYDYRMHTNNFGLVQDRDVMPGPASLLLLGDSFTEGVGAEPWFRSVAPEIRELGYQPINGGIGGTGFESWLKLSQYLAAAGIRIRKVVIPFISDDYRRPAWNVLPGELRCFSARSACPVDKGVYFRYRLPPPQQLPSFVAKVRAGRATAPETAKQRLITLLPATYQVYQYIAGHLGLAESVTRDETGEWQSPGAIAALVNTYGRANVAFLHLPEKTEIGTGPDALGMAARRAIHQAGGKLFDGFTLCHLAADDYYPHDIHPNRNGYAKIAACTLGIIKEVGDGSPAR